MKRKKTPGSLLTLCLTLLLALSLLPVGVTAVEGEAESTNAGESAYRSLDELAGKRVGVMTGTIHDELLAKRVPSAQPVYFTSQADMLAALKAGKIDAFGWALSSVMFMRYEDSSITWLDEHLMDAGVGFLFPKSDEAHALDAQMSEYIDGLIASGELDALVEKWFGPDESTKTILDYAALPAENGTLRMATAANAVPFTYVRDNVVVGYEIELAARFCQENGYNLQIEQMDFSGILPAVQTGKCDFAGSCLAMTAERKEHASFSTQHYSDSVVFVVLDDTAAAGEAEATSAKGDSAYRSLDELAGKQIGVMTGTIHDELLAKRVPSAEPVYFTSQADMLAALKAGKIDAFGWALSSVIFMRYEDSSITWLDEHLMDAGVGFLFPKTDEDRSLKAQMSEYIDGLIASGELDALVEKWFGPDESTKTILDYAALPAENGTLRMATSANAIPFTYVRDNTVVGYEIELAARFCQENGYNLQIEQMDFSGLLPAVQTGKCDFAGSCLAMTAERKEHADFSTQHYSDSVVFVVLDDAAAGTGSSFLDGIKGFFEGIQTSFYNTFVRENRWVLFLQGIGTTMLITVLSILFGTLLGFAVYMACRNGNPVANALTRFCVWLVQGMPVVVLLMILYYIIFGKSSVSGTVVSVAGFTLIFSAGVYAMLLSGVNAIPKGQTEAAYALGYGNVQTFFRVLLPQAVPHFLPAFKGEIVALIKATAVVGYISVQDLTRMSDIVRGRTYEPFFPLISVAVFYFILAAILKGVVSRLEVVINPKRRKKEDILKGVETHD